MAALVLDMKEATTSRERVKFLTSNYDLSENNAKALILSELGYSHSGIASRLGVTDSTARKYLDTLEDEIGDRVTQALPKDIRYATFPGDDVSEPEYSGNQVDVSPEMSEQRTPVNKGTPISEIDEELIG